MRAAVGVIGSAFQDAWDDLWTNLALNLIWLICQLLVIPGPPATLALFHFANLAAKGEVTDFHEFWGAFRRNFWTAWRWALLNLLVLALLLGDYLLSGGFRADSTAGILQGLYLALLAIWLLVQLYTLPFLLEQSSPGVLRAERNAIVLLGRNIRFSLVLGALLIVILMVGIPVFFLSMALGAMLIAAAGNHAVLDRLAAHLAGDQTERAKSSSA